MKTAIDPNFKMAVCEQLIGLTQLQKNWDGYGAPPIDRKIVKAACTFIESLPENLACRPRVVPMSAGNLQLEWDRDETSLELEFETAETIHFLKWNPDENIEEEDTFPATDIARAVELIQWFMGESCL